MKLNLGRIIELIFVSIVFGIIVIVFFWCAYISSDMFSRVFWVVVGLFMIYAYNFLLLKKDA